MNYKNIYNYISRIPYNINPGLHFFVYKMLIKFKLRRIINDPVITLILKNVKNGDCVIDIGANMGTYAYSIAKKISPDGTVFAFEANPVTASQLKKNLKLSNVTIETCALSSEVGQKDFFMHTVGTGPTSSIEYFEELDEDGELESTMVQCNTLDEYCTANKLTPNLIKIDVEGHEFQVIMGGIQTIKKHSPIIIFEFIELWWEEKKIKDIFNLLSETYQLYRIEDGANALEAYHDFKIPKCDDFRLSANVNIVCYPRR